MGDKELLEKAAKAAGLGEVWYLEGSETPYVGPRYELGQPIRYQVFNPLTDDGDAFRLQVKLRMEVYEGAGDGPEAWVGVYLRNSRQKFFCESIGEDSCAAFRRAIARAAAALEEPHHAG